MKNISSSIFQPHRRLEKAVITWHPGWGRHQGEVDLCTLKGRVLLESGTLVMSGDAGVGGRIQGFAAKAVSSAEGRERGSGQITK